MTFRAVRLLAERARAHATARLVRSQKRSQGAVKHIDQLVQNFFPQGARLRASDCRIRLESTESPRGDSRETQDAGRRTRDEKPATKINERKNFAAVRSRVVRPFSIFRGRALP